MTENLTKRRCWLQFRLRTLLIAVLVLSLPLSWFAVRMEKARRQREAVEVIVEAGGEVTYEPAMPAAPNWAREAFDDDFFVDVVEVDIFGPDFGDHEAVCLKKLPKLWRLLFHDTQVTNAGLEHLKGLTHLRRLSIYGTHVTDSGLTNLRGLANLQILQLDNTLITNAGLQYLAGLASLTELSLNGTHFTPAGIEKLQEALPNCKIGY